MPLLMTRKSLRIWRLKAWRVFRPSLTKEGASSGTSALPLLERGLQLLDARERPNAAASSNIATRGSEGRIEVAAVHQHLRFEDDALAVGGGLEHGAFLKLERLPDFGRNGDLALGLEARNKLCRLVRHPESI